VDPYIRSADKEEASYWQSRPDDTSPSLTLHLGEAGGHVGKVVVSWTRRFAAVYSLEVSADGVSWTRVVSEEFGDGGVDTFGLLEQDRRRVTRFVRLVNMSPPDDSETRAVGVHEFQVFGYPLAARETSVHISPLFNETAPFGVLTAPFEAVAAKTPTVRAVTPSRGTTAGGTRLTVYGNFLSTSSTSALTVSLGEFSCVVDGVVSSDGGEDSVECVAEASGVLHGGVKHVVVSTEGVGSSVPSCNTTANYWYVDVWSSRNTWGGAAPPTGCGAWHLDPECSDSVYIPEGQVVLLDISLPRFLLILIEGTLIFDRTDIEMSASYILIRSGTLQVRRR